MPKAQSPVRRRFAVSALFLRARESGSPFSRSCGSGRKRTDAETGRVAVGELFVVLQAKGGHEQGVSMRAGTFPSRDPVPPLLPEDCAYVVVVFRASPEREPVLKRPREVVSE